MTDIYDQASAVEEMQREHAIAKQRAKSPPAPLWQS